MTCNCTPTDYSREHAITCPLNPAYVKPVLPPKPEPLPSYYDIAGIYTKVSGPEGAQRRALESIADSLLKIVAMMKEKR